MRRPGVLESVSLDLFLMRQVAVALRSVPEVKSDWAGIIDAWAARFLEEMDYGLEAQNTAQFKQGAPRAGVWGRGCGVQARRGRGHLLRACTCARHTPALLAPMPAPLSFILPAPQTWRRWRAC